MKRPHLVWLAFAACALVGFGVLGWFTSEMLRYERAGDDARRLAAIEENTRLALWRMDSALAGIHGVEAARPVQDYEPFFRADGAFTRELTPLPAGTVMLPSPLLGFTPPFVRLHFQIDPDGAIRSPQAPPGALRNAALAAGVAVNRLDNGVAALTELRGRIANGELAALRASAATALAAQEKKELRRSEESNRDAREFDQVASADEATSRVEKIAPQITPVATEPPPPVKQQQQPPLPAQQQADPTNQPQNAQIIQEGKNYAEQQQRQDLLLTQNEINVSNRRRGQSAMPRDADLSAAAGSGAGASAPGSIIGALPATRGAISGLMPPSSAAPSAPATDAPRTYDSSAASGAITPAPVESAPQFADGTKDAPPPTAKEAELPKAKGDKLAANPVPPEPRDEVASEGPMQALWVGDELVFARRVALGERVLVQGAWLDWGELRAWLLSRITDLLPAARLEPASAETPALAVEATRRLAFIPAQLVPGPVNIGNASSWSPLQISLSAAWCSAFLGALALALLLHGTLRLSERRGAFVSAVTHELRTPLTTFRMYTEMLAGGMVPDETKRRSYLDTLRKEAERLSHLVENVLSYARLERGRASARVEETTPGALLTRIEERLRQRAQQGGLALRVAFAADTEERALRTDTTAVEQILFNLVDNATKYARRADGAGGIVIEISRATTGSRGFFVRVSDNGPGIAPSVRRRLFEPFSKSATEAAHSQPGVGLGLALSRRLARDELHGDLVLERTGSDGTVFRVELPGG